MLLQRSTGPIFCISLPVSQVPLLFHPSPCLSIVSGIFLSSLSSFTARQISVRFNLLFSSLLFSPHLSFVNNLLNFLSPSPSCSFPSFHFISLLSRCYLLFTYFLQLFFTSLSLSFYLHSHHRTFLLLFFTFNYLPRLHYSDTQHCGDISVSPVFLAPAVDSFTPSLIHFDCHLTYEIELFSPFAHPVSQLTLLKSPNFKSSILLHTLWACLRWMWVSCWSISHPQTEQQSLCHC